MIKIEINIKPFLKKIIDKAKIDENAYYTISDSSKENLIRLEHNYAKYIEEQIQEGELSLEDITKRIISMATEEKLDKMFEEFELEKNKCTV